MVEVDELRVQCPTAAVIEVAAREGVLAGLVAADAAERRGVLEDGDVLLDAWGTRGGIGRARTVLALADGRRESPLETRVAFEAQREGIPLEPQFIVRTARGEWVAQVDFRVIGTRVLIEADGVGKYRSHQDFKNERVRHNHIEELGWIVVRVVDDDLRCGRFIPRLRGAMVRSADGPRRDAT